MLLNVPRLYACPFCRTIHPGAKALNCPECDVKLVPMENLPPSVDALLDEAEAGEMMFPEQRELPRNYCGSGRGALLVLAAVGLATFFLPWVEVRMPDGAVRSGFDLARGRAGWLWGGAAGWLVMIPLVWTRRTIASMRGVRFVTVLLAAATSVEVAMLLSLPPHGSHHVPVQIVWLAGIYASLVTSLAGVAVGCRFGGSLERLPRIVTELSSEDPSESSAGKTLH
jgi:hypothetical protein